MVPSEKGGGGSQMEEKKIYISSSLIDLMGCLVTSFSMKFTIIM